MTPNILFYVTFDTTRKSLGGSKRIPFKNNGGHRVLRDCQCCRHFLYPSRDLCLDTILSLRSTSKSFDLMAWFFLWNARSTVGPYKREVCAFPNHVQSIEFITGGLQSSCRNISRMINGNWIYLISILSLIAKGLIAYVNKVFKFFYF